MPTSVDITAEILFYEHPQNISSQTLDGLLYAFLLLRRSSFPNSSTLLKEETIYVFFNAKFLKICELVIFKVCKYKNKFLSTILLATYFKGVLESLVVGRVSQLPRKKLDQFPDSQNISHIQ